MKKLMTLMAGVAMLALFMPMQASAQSGQNAKLALEAAVTPGPAAAEEIKRLEEHAGERIYRGLDRDAEFQEPLLSQPRPSPEQPEKEEAREEQPEPPEVRPKEPQAPTGSVACNAANRLAGRCISNITVHGARRADNADVVVHRAGQSDNRFQRVHRAGGSDQSLIRVHRAGQSDNRFQRVHRAGGSDQARIRVHGFRDRIRVMNAWRQYVRLYEAYWGTKFRGGDTRRQLR